MIKPPALALVLLLALAAAPAAFAQDAPAAHPGEEPVDPYAVSNANAAARPLADPALAAAFHGREGMSRIAADVVDRAAADPRIGEIFKSHDLVRLKRTLAEQICYVLGGGCDYTGRDMTASHKDLGVQNADFNALVEDLQAAMDKEGVPFAAQNRLLAKLAPMHREVVQK